MQRLRDLLQPPKAPSQHVAAGQWPTAVPAKPNSSDSDTDALLSHAFRRHQRSRRDVLRRHLPFSWGRVLFGLISLALVFSDIPRSSLGIHGLSSSYTRVQPDEFVVAGPSNISTLSGDRAKAARTSLRVWLYKFDTMSVVWRAFADNLDVREFPECFHYKSDCPGEMFNGSVAFDMLDALADAFALRRRTGGTAYTRSASEPTAITIRSISELRDRFHHYLLAALFLGNVWRTNQALYYPPELLDRHLSRAVGAGGHLCYSSGTRPFFCSELWTNFKHMCKGSASKKCPRAVGVVQSAIMARVRKFQGQFPNLTLDLSLLESQDDWQMARGGLVPVGFRRADVSTVIRVRDCSSSSSSTASSDDCETVFVDEFRYQTARTMSDADQWYFIVAVLRSAGQGYFYVRFLALLLGCYRLQVLDDEGGGASSVLTRARRTAKLLAKVPVQTVVYGSPFPVLCYAAAHLVDATITYTVLSNMFLSFLGLVGFSVQQFISLAVMQMRNVWLYALFLHVVVRVSSARRWLAWAPSLGVRGVPEFLVGAVSAITISSQYRSPAFRSTRIFELHEVPSTLGNRVMGAVRYQHGFLHRGSGDVMLGGVIIDLKFLFCALVALVGVVVVVNLALKAATGSVLRGKKPAYLRLWGKTPVPYSVGELWPASAVCVHWTHEYFCIGREARPSKVLSVATASLAPASPPPTDEPGAGTAVTMFATVPRRSSSLHTMRKMLTDSATSIANNPPSPFMGREVFAFIQRQMQQLHARGEQVSANVAFMNLVALSDPTVLFYLYVAGGGAGTRLGYYRSMRHPDKVFLLPVAVVTEENEHTYDLELLRKVAASQVSWSRLLQCG